MYKYNYLIETVSPLDELERLRLSLILIDIMRLIHPEESPRVTEEETSEVVN